MTVAFRGQPLLIKLDGHRTNCVSFIRIILFGVVRVNFIGVDESATDSG